MVTALSKVFKIELDGGVAPGFTTIFATGITLSFCVFYLTTL
jgi:hypothetical protein